MSTPRPTRLLHAPETPTVDAHLADITQPGHGWAHGVMILARRDVTLHGVHLVQVTVEDRLTCDTETLYFTDDGFEIAPTVGTYGDGIRWSVGTYADPARSRRQSLGLNLRHVANLSQAAEVIRKAQR